LGDRDQLPSVEAGDVLAAIVDAADDDGRGALRGHRVHLERGWRQDDTLRLAPLADAVRRSDAPEARDEAIALLRGGALSGVHFHEDLAEPLRDAAFDDLLAHWRALQAADDPAAALRAASRARLLTVLREGPQGARTLNQHIEARLAGPRRDPYFPGRLLLVTENSYRHRLFNGDIGICLPDADGAPVAWFPGDDPGHPRAFHPAALPAHDSAFAMTVHKAQGSEFDTVWLLLPRRPNRVLSRELVYTGITRARRELHLAAGDAIVRDALSRHAGRWSGLGRRLGAPADGSA
ncbi:MAG: ATP-binding domain-containing protein, partial [Luteimonas sp.]|nr:ATP-binding domain-containing protein [Luteimonas sp.]